MPTAKEFTISLEDKPGTLGKLCRLSPKEASTFSRINSSLTKGQGLCPSRCGQIRIKPRRSGPSTQ